MMIKATPFLAAAALLFSVAASAQPIEPKVQARIDRILKRTPLIDGHNDIAEQLRKATSAASAGSPPGPTGANPP